MGPAREGVVFQAFDQSLPESCVVLLSPLVKLIQSHLPDSPGGAVDDSQKRHVVVRVDRHSKVGQGVLDLPSMIKTHSSNQLIRYAKSAKSFLELTRLEVGTVQNSDALGSLVEMLIDFLGNIGGFAPGLQCGKEFDGLALLLVRPKDFPFSFEVVGDDTGGSVQDGLS